MKQDFVIRGALMPDAHAGYSLPIGAVVATEGGELDRDVRVQPFRGDPVQDLEVHVAVVARAGLVVGRITSCNVCYTKVLRIPPQHPHREKDGEMERRAEQLASLRVDR